MDDQTPAYRPSGTNVPSSAAKAVDPGGGKLGLIALSGLVIGSMIGGGAFNLPANMAGKAGIAAVAIAWALTFVGMFFLSNSLRTLATKRPELKAGIYSYAQAGFGPLAGFQMAWGYWLSAAFGNVALSVLWMQILGYFFPVFGNGQNWPSLIGASVLVWGMFLAVASGVKRMASLSAIASALNMTTITVVLVVMAVFATQANFSFDIWGEGFKLGSVFSQVKTTMLVTLWVFIGVEAAVVVSDRAQKMSDIGPATFIGLGVCTVLYSALSLLPFGSMHQDTLSGLANPSSAYVLEAIVGRWGAIFVNVALLCSVTSSWLAWTILVAELPYQGAKGRVFPKFLMRENAAGAPFASLLLSSVIQQAMLFVVLFAHNAWLWLITITGVMILPPYLASTLYLTKYANEAGFDASTGMGRTTALLIGGLGSVYCVWLLYAAGPQFVLMSAIIFALGIPVFWFARRENFPDAPAFTTAESVAVLLLLAAAAAGIVLFALGIVTIS
jgi:arginine:ornithine antiporter/lysine permease